MNIVNVKVVIVKKNNSLFYAQPKGYIKNMRMIMGLQAWMEQESCCYYQNWWRN